MADIELCLKCRLYSEHSRFPETYGTCLWQPDIPARPALGALNFSLNRVLADESNRWVPKHPATRTEGPRCDTFVEKTDGAATAG